MELEEERKQRLAAVNGRKKVEADFKAMEQQIEMADKVKDDAIKQLKKLQVKFYSVSFSDSVEKLKLNIDINCSLPY